MPGVNGDLSSITVYTSTTPVHFSTSNVPLTELDGNVLINDLKLNGYIQTGEVTFSFPGDGLFVIPILFTVFTPMATVPRIVSSLADVVGTPIPTLHPAAASRTTAGFDAIIEAAGTAGAWVAKFEWLADGR